MRDFRLFQLQHPLDPWRAQHPILRVDDGQYEDVRSPHTAHVRVDWQLNWCTAILVEIAMMKPHANGTAQCVEVKPPNMGRVRSCLAEWDQWVVLAAAAACWFT